jgi:iron complex outermembrane receptor protein
LYQFFGCVGAGTNFSDQDFTYDPVAAFGSCAAGESDSAEAAHDNTIGITPKLTLFPDDHNTIVIGGLLAKQTSGSALYLYGNDEAAQHEEDGVDSFTLGGGTARTIFSAYAQDTIRLLDNKLQITPGVKVDAAYTDNIQQTVYGEDTLTVNGVNKFQNYTKIGGYYLGASYNLPDNFILYGSLGKGSLFAPTNNYSGGLASGIPGGTDVPTPEIVHLFEGGLRYDTPRLLLNLDYYYQAIADGFSFYEDFAQDTQFYGNTVGYLFRGVEGNGKFLITPNFSVFGNFAFDKAEYTKTGPASVTLTQDQFGEAFSGTPLSNVPDWTGLVGAEYDYGPLSLYATGQYTGREYTTYDINAAPYGNTCTLNSNPSTVVTCDPTSYDKTTETLIPANVLDGATATNTNILNPANFLVNLLFTYKIPVHAPLLKSLTADLNIQNLFDTHYYSYTFSSENPVNGVYDPNLPGGQPYNEAFEGQPRSFTVDLIAKF